MKVSSDNLKTIVPLKEGSQNSTCENGNVYYKGITFGSELDGAVLLHVSAYEMIFGKKRKNSGKGKKRLAVVKISCGKESIHREYKGILITGFSKNGIGLTYNSQRLLFSSSAQTNDKAQALKEITITPGHWIPFFWNHPDKAIMISTRLGIIGIALGVLSIILSIT